MSGHEEIVLTIEQLRREFEELGVRGLRRPGHNGSPSWD